MLLGDFLDVHAAERLTMITGFLRRAVDGDRGIGFFRNRTASLRRSNDLIGSPLGFWRLGGIGVAMISSAFARPSSADVRKFDLAGFTATAHQNLRFDDPVAGLASTNSRDFFRRSCACCLRGTGMPARRNSSFP